MLRFLPVLALTIACAPDNEPRVVEAAPIDEPSSEFFPSTDSGARLAGTMPTIGQFDALATEVFDDRYDEDWSYLEVHTVTETGWAMFALDLNWQDLREQGETRALYAIGCSGPSYGDYTFDGGADEVIVAIEANSLDASLEDEAVFTLDFGTTGQIVAVVPIPSDR